MPESFGELTPEQILIEGIQERVTEFTKKYAEGLILSIDANFALSRLIVKVSDDWYELPNSKQIEIGNQILQKAKDLDFKKLKITNSQGELLARSPVIGQEILIINN